MKRSKRQKVKQENQEPVASSHGENEEHDLAYFIHDRVELMHQVFSILKPKEILAMAPGCVRGVSIQDLQELCTDELLGISSKRLCAVLDGAEPPSDTESSSASPEQMETISLDSISSDEEILSHSSSKKHKHRRHSKKKEKDKSRENHKSKERDRAKSPSQTTKEARAGLTVLELLELQARARAIRAQLTKDKSLNKQVQSEVPQSSVDSSSSGSEIEIKEEPALVVEISSEDEKPGPEQLREYLDNMPASTSNCTVTRREPSSSKQNETNNSTTKRVNDLIITVPQAKTNRKIKLNRHRISETNNIIGKPETEKDSNMPQKSNIEQKSATETVQTISDEKTSNSSNKKDKKRKDKKKTKKLKDNTEKEGSDHDEITLQLSDSEKMDLLEDLGGNKGKDSSSSKDSESSSEDSDVSSDNGSIKQKKQDEPSKADAEIVSPDNEKVCVKLNDQDKCTAEIPKASNQSEVNNLIVDNTDTISITNTESPSKVVEEEKSDKDVGTTSNDLKQSDETIGDKVEQIATDVEKESSNIKDSDVVSSSCEEKQKSGQIKLDAEKETSNITESPKVQCGIEEKPKVLPKKEIERLMVEEIGLNIESQLSISATSQDDRHSSVRQSSDVEPMDVDDVISEKSVEISNIKDLSIVETQKDKGSKSIESSIRNSPKSSQNLVEVGNVLKETLHIVVAGDSRSVSNKQIDASGKRKADVKNKSDGEITDGGSSEIEAVDLQQEVVYISDDDKNEKMSKKKKKKDKKAKKEKKAKKSKSDFREDSDQNFFSDPKVSNISVSAKNSENTVSDVNSKLSVLEQSKPLIIDEDDDICEVLELSDDSSCYEVEGVSLLSKEPTAEEIQALSSKIDEIDREEVVTDEQIKEHENMLANKEQNESNIEDIENISWKDRYLSSRKVKMVLSTSSIFNAMRKKNKDLKKKIEMAKKEAENQLPEETPNSNDNTNSNPLEEGSIEHFNALTGSTKYVNPVQENTANGDTNETEQDANKDVTKEMKKDAKQLLKMYKRLLKYNDVNKQKDPNKKKKKKSKKSKDKSKDASKSISTEL